MANEKAERVARAAIAQVGVTTLYDPAYVRLTYPMGDVPVARGVCTDVVVRAFRTGAGVDLQKLVHEDVLRAGRAPYDIRRADRNIDHRRVVHLMTFFRRQGRAILPPSRRPSDYRTGDVVAWRLANGRLHIGVVVENGRAAGSPNPPVVHNIGVGARREDVLFAWPVLGHYRYFR